MAGLLLSPQLLPSEKVLLDESVSNTLLPPFANLNVPEYASPLQRWPFWCG